MSPEPNNITRRSLFQIAVGGAAVIGLGSLSACATGGGGTTGGGSSQAPGGEKSADNPLGVDKKAALEVIIFNGGYGDKYGAEHVALYNKWAGGEVAKMKSTVKIATELQPRFQAANPPEVFDNSGADALPRAQLVAQKQIADLTPLLDAPSVDDPSKKIKDILAPGTVAQGSFDGVPRELNYVFSMWGIWYSSKLFGEKGWTVPKTWEEFVSLSDKIKTDGKMAPFIHTGVHTQYMMAIIATMAVKNGGLEYAKKLDNLEDGAWKDDAMLKVAKAWREYYDKGYILPGCEGLDHTTSQTEWALGKAAMIPVGSWLENELKDKTTGKSKAPDGFDMKVFATPSMSGDKLPNNAIRGGAGEPFMVSEASKNKAGGMEYLRQMLSNSATAKFAELTGNLAAVKDAGKRLTNPSTALKSVADASEAAGNNVFQLQYDTWYAPLKNASKDWVRNLLTGKATPEQFCENMQKAADQVKADPKITKYKVQ
ncbi:carbohydrate ABC transporter, N-acetylglucosamine/diacetylchitobiose-binding protein [Enemella dayhoffiae]|uniref:Carbohydrate ABC transporter, N-acetylglucosamine/diacetylchitobiose-binding protein n=1 Tax=Enemella dayhoffiae TaxID=2016507 RepID=A0A255H116_9ACTN|nr:N-acetylglucosamine/diacetylchitobiose ABC transporter substrate-binding protein [Enemella dayhoffiae]OYO21370.1 carbohydrate ABC transporter, N-acetylglucosamine/diacetylchitobiose-binding protein [Enemella dayhoffiae]